MTPSDAGKYFAKTYRNSNTKFKFVETIKANSNFYMYTEEQLRDIWDALDVVYEIAINDTE
jgi:hypothetical protein